MQRGRIANDCVKENDDELAQHVRRPMLAAMLKQRLLGPLAMLLAAALTACGGGSGADTVASNGCGATSCGAAVVTITDAPGDFLSYTVNIVSLKLQRDDGTVVETLPVTTAVDFATLVDLTEVISARQIPPGKYVAGTVTLDYAGATIVVDDGTSANGRRGQPGGRHRRRTGHGRDAGAARQQQAAGHHREVRRPHRLRLQPAGVQYRGPRRCPRRPSA